MAVYKVMGPDGKTHKFEGPDGASPQEVEQFAEQAFGHMFPARTEGDKQGQYQVNEMGAGERFAAGMGERVDRTLDGITQMVLQHSGHQGAIDAHNKTVAEKKEIAKPLMASTAGSAGGFAGDAAMTAIPAAKGVGLASKLPNAVARVAGRLGAGGAVGGAFAGAQPVDPGESRTGNTMFGFGGGAAGQALGDIGAKAITGLVPKSPTALRLAPEVQDKLTLGQIADKDSLAGRFVNGLEEKSKSIYGVGDIVASQRRKGVDAWRDSVIKKGTPEGHVPDGQNTRELLDSNSQEFQNRYSAALKGNAIAPVQAFESRVGRTTQDPRLGMTKDQGDEIYRKVMSYYDNLYGARPVGPNGSMVHTVAATDGPQAKQFEAFLSDQARQYARSTNPGSKGMAQALSDIERAWTATYRRQLPVPLRQELNPLDSKYAQYKAAERAAGYTGNDQGAFTPAQMVNAIKARTSPGEFGRQRGLLQKDADAAKSLLQDRVPDSGTAGRSMLTGGFAAGMGLEPVTTGAALGTVLAGTTKTGRNVATGDAATQKLIRALYGDKLVAGAGVPLGLSLMDE